MIKLGTKVYRNIQEQVAKNTDDIAKLWRRPIFQIVVVAELPEEGIGGILYLLPVEDPEENNYYEEYIWVDLAWELIGTTAVDISNMCTTDTDQTITGIKTFSSDIYALEKRIRFNSGGSQSIGYYSASYSSWGAPIGGVLLGNYEFKPSADNAMDLGTSTAGWKDAYLKGKIDLKGSNYNCWLQNTDNRLCVYYGNSIRFRIGNTDTDFYTNANPYSNNTYSLGSLSAQWKEIYLSGKLTFGNASNFIQFSSGTGKLYSNIGVLVNGDVQLQNGNITDGTNSASVADIAALITYAKAQGWIS